MTAADLAAADYPVVIRPLRLSLGMTIVGGIYLAVIGGILLWIGITWRNGPYSGWSWALAILGGLIVVYGTVIAIRGPRVAVILTEDEAFVRGAFTSRRIPRSQITGMASYPTIQWTYPAISWTDLSGRAHKTPITAVSVNRTRSIRSVRDRADEGVWMIRSWIAGQNPSAEQARIHTLEAARYRVPLAVTRPAVVLALVGAGVCMAVLIAVIASRGFSLNSFGVGVGSVASGNATDDFLRFYPSNPIQTPAPLKGAPPVDTSVTATNERQIVDYQLLLIANRLIVAHHTNTPWPASVSVGADGIAMTSDGQSLGAVPSNYQLGYIPLSGRTNFVMTLTDSAGTGVAVNVNHNSVTAF